MAEEPNQSVVDKLKSHWFLILALVSMTSAFAESRIKIQTLEDAVKSNASTQKEVVDLKTQTARVDERTKAMLESQARQERMIEILIEQQRTIIRSQTLN